MTNPVKYSLRTRKLFAADHTDWAGSEPYNNVNYSLLNQCGQRNYQESDNPQNTLSYVYNETINQVRIQKLRNAINAGIYAINADHIARRFLEFEVLLNNKENLAHWPDGQSERRKLH